MKITDLRCVLFLGLLMWQGAANAQIGSASASLDWAKKKCVELGFKSGTERFGNCVLQLSRDDVRPSIPVMSSETPSNKVKALSAPATTEVQKLVVTSPKIELLKDCDDCPEMVVIPAGMFLMGSKADPFASPQPIADEQPQHQVTIQPFAMGKYEVTQEQWYAVMGTLPSKFKGRTLPVEQVSWDDAQEFVKRLSEKTGKNYRLPSEAEWEYAARAGSQTRYYFGDNENDLGRYAWFSGNSRDTTHQVGEKEPNAFGLHDMLGNVWEWTADCWNDNYNGAPSDGSGWTSGPCGLRVLRGGSWVNDPQNARSAFRTAGSASYRTGILGFRLARMLP